MTAPSLRALRWRTGGWPDRDGAAGSAREAAGRRKHSGKIPPAERRRWADEILAKGDGRITIHGLAWGRRKLGRMRKAYRHDSRDRSSAAGPDEYGRLLAQSLEPGPPQKPPAADWTVWAHIDRCKLWEAVVLTLDFEPTYLAPLEDGRGNLGIVPRRSIASMPLEAAIYLLPSDDVQNIQGRLRIALSQPNTVIQSLDHFFAPRTVDTDISLPDFGSSARTRSTQGSSAAVSSARRPYRGAFSRYNEMGIGTALEGLGAMRVRDTSSRRSLSLATWTLKMQRSFVWRSLKFAEHLTILTP